MMRRGPKRSIHWPSSGEQRPTVTAPIAKPLEYGFAAPAEFRTQRFYKNRERVDEKRAKARHHAKACCQHHPPAVISEVEFSRARRRFGVCDCSHIVGVADQIQIPSPVTQRPVRNGILVYPRGPYAASSAEVCHVDRGGTFGEAIRLGERTQTGPDDRCSVFVLFRLSVGLRLV